MRWALTLILTGLPLIAAGSSDFPDADVVFLGEIHDNPQHHATQADWTANIAPKALVFEMLTMAQASAARDADRSNANTLETALGWNDSGWPDFAMYFPIFAAAPDAVIYGAAVPRDAARAAMKTGSAEAFGTDAGVYGLSTALPQDQQTTRETLQQDAHCGALPEAMLPLMVDVQRLRDASLARAAVTALAETGGPVVVITGNGHARRDWGAPAYVTRADPRATVFSLLQFEGDDAPDAALFDASLGSDAIARPDPCAAFAPASD